MSARVTTVAVAATAGLPLISISAPNVALPALAAGLGASFALLQWVIAAYALALGALQLVAGTLADRFGRRRATVLGLALFGAGGLGAALAPGAGALVAARVVSGIGGAFVLTGALGLVAAQFGAGDRLKVLALRSAIIATAFAIGPLAGGVLTDLLGWRAVFAFDAALALPLLLVLAAGADDGVGAGRAARIDWPGTVALTVALAGLLYALIRTDAAGAVVAAAAGAVVAVRQRAGHPLVPPELLRDRGLATSVLSLLVLYVSVFGGFVYVTLYLREVCGLTPAATGALLTVFAATSLAAVLAVTRSPRRDRLELWIPVALAVAAAGLLSFAAVAGTGSQWPLLPGLALTGLAAGVINPLLTANQMGAFDPSDGGIAAGLNGASRQLGTALGTALLGVLVGGAVEARGGTLGDLDHEAVAAGLASGLRLSALAGALLLLAAVPVAARGLATPSPRA